ncbi:MAG: radical SAM protein [Acidobacteriota bacterium]
MRPSAFNVQVPLANGELFLMNTLTDAQLVVSPDVVALLGRLDEGAAEEHLAPEERTALLTLADHGFVTPSREAERGAVERHFAGLREDATQLRVTILTTLQCNFACDYCYQGDRGELTTPLPKMSVEVAERVADWIGRELDLVRPSRLVVTFFGGEPLLNLPAVRLISRRSAELARERHVDVLLNVITNGLLLTPELVDELLPLGLNGIKVTLDGDRETHDRVRPLRGGQGTFDRIIDNIRRVAGKVPVAIGGNFDASTAERYPGLLDFLKEQDFAPRISRVAFKPVIKPAPPAAPRGAIPLTPVGSDRTPLGGTCLSVAGASSGSVCDSCHFVDDQMSFLRDETVRRGFRAPDGLHMGPCELYRRHSHTIGPDGALYACPGFTGDNALSVGHINGLTSPHAAESAARFDRLAPWRQCGDCSFIPVCGGGCAVAAHTELGDMEAPSCHKRAFESALVSVAEETAATIKGAIQ